MAAIAFVRSQWLNQAEWFSRILNEVESKSERISTEGYTPENILTVIIFYSKIFPYYHYRLIAARMWVIIERDLSQFLELPIVRDWLRPGAVEPRGFPSIGQFDCKFIAYLRDLQSRGR